MKYTCKCGNEIDDVINPNTIDIQWTEAYGCDICKDKLPKPTKMEICGEGIMTTKKGKGRF